MWFREISLAANEKRKEEEEKERKGKKREITEFPLHQGYIATDSAGLSRSRRNETGPLMSFGLAFHQRQGAFLRRPTRGERCTRGGTHVVCRHFSN